jgi:adenylate kinase family enzyme/MFS family permease
MSKRPALLLIGPTGAGKSPLGAYLEHNGFRGRPCVHFDFGAELRAAAAAGDDPDLAASDRAVIRRVLQTGALLEDREFPIARAVFRRFLKRKSADLDNWVVLNGLPRHVGQAAGLEGEVEVRLVVFLQASAEVVAERIRSNPAGDRTGRVDDDPDSIEAKLKTFAARTAPLVEHYAERGAEIIRLDVGPASSAGEMAGFLAASMEKNKAPGAGRALTVLSLAVFLASSTWFTGTAAGPYFKALWGLGPARSAWLTIAVQLGFIAGTLGFAFLNLADIFPARRVFALSAMAGALFNAAFAWPGRAYPAALVLRFLTGVSLAGVYPVGLKIVAQWFRGGLGRPLSRLIAALTLGSSMPFLLQALGGRLDPHLLLGAGSVLAALGAVLVGRGLADGPFQAAPARFDWRAASRAFSSPPFRLQAWGYFGHMWELYAFWSLGGVFLGAALAGSPWGGERTVAAIGFFVFLAGVGGCLLGGARSRKRGEKAAAVAALEVSAVCCVLSPLFFGFPAWALVLFLMVWGAAVIADSAPFSGLAARFCEAPYLGTALAVQNGLGFAVTVVSIQVTVLAAGLVGWRWAFLILLPGPVFGRWAANRLSHAAIGPKHGRV